MEYLLFDYSKVQSKKNNKCYLIATCIVKGGYNRVLKTIVLPYTEMNEEFLKNNVTEYITSYIHYSLSKDGNIVPYIKY